jgi:mRNA-degrading endonuclease toxin of MazEF toxin-antitoxin module
VFIVERALKLVLLEILELLEVNKKGTIKLEHIRSIDKSRIIGKIGSASEEIMHDIKVALLKTCDFY